MANVLRVLNLVNWVSGIAVIVYGAKRHLNVRDLPAVLISLAAAIVGPVEDVCKRWVRRRAATTEEPLVTFVDKTTSASFLVLLVWVLLVTR